MKYSLLLVICLLAVVNYTTQIKSLSQVDTPNLKYYHRYEKNHGQKINPNVPLHQHYRNERHLREQANGVKDEIEKTLQQAGFNVRELKHKIIRIKNNVNKDRAIRNGVLRMSQQRENSVKEEINHEEKFKELYEQRLRKITEE